MEFKLLPMKLQLLAEGGEGGDTTATGGNPSGEGGSTGGEGESTPKMFTQEELNAILAKEKREHASKMKEAEEKAKLSEAEKVKYDLEKLQEKLANREKEIAQKELASNAKTKLGEKNIPIALADFLDYTDEESCELSIGKLEKVFNESVQKAVEKKLAGQTEYKKAPEGKADDTYSQILNGMRKA